MSHEFDKALEHWNSTTFMTQLQVLALVAYAIDEWQIRNPLDGETSIMVKAVPTTIWMRRTDPYTWWSPTGQNPVMGFSSLDYNWDSPRADTLDKLLLNGPVYWSNTIIAIVLHVVCSLFPYAWFRALAEMILTSSHGALRVV